MHLPLVGWTWMESNPWTKVWHFFPPLWKVAKGHWLPFWLAFHPSYCLAGIIFPLSSRRSWLTCSYQQDRWCCSTWPKTGLCSRLSGWHLQGCLWRSVVDPGLADIFIFHSALSFVGSNVIDIMQLAAHTASVFSIFFTFSGQGCVLTEC